jgi:hypothetical protein
MQELANCLSAAELWIVSLGLSAWLARKRAGAVPE